MRVFFSRLARREKWLVWKEISKKKRYIDFYIFFDSH